MKELRHTLRSLARRPGFTLVVVATLGLGIGANTTLFDLLNLTVWRRPAIERPREVVRVHTRSYVEWIGAYGNTSWGDFQDYRERSASFAGLAAEVASAVGLDTGEITELVAAGPVSSNYFEVLGVGAAAGRVLAADDGEGGGAQAVAALAYGTESVPAVDKIVGPGNAYVASAKRMVFGKVGIDMIAGPSEILVICDGRTDPDWIAVDLFSQAEHDEDAQSILVSPDGAFLERVAASIGRLLPDMTRAEIIAASLAGQGALIQVRDMNEAIDIANQVAPEHLELSVEDPGPLAARIRHAGAIFMGRYTAEVLGDYCAGPNHVLPTSRTARFSSPLGVYDFQKRSSLIQCSPAGASTLGRIAAVLAHGEGLTAHARSAEVRILDQD